MKKTKKIITKKLKSYWTLKAEINRFGDSYHAFLELSHKKHGCKYMNTLHRVGTESLETLESIIEGFETMQQVMERYWY